MSDAVLAEIRTMRQQFDALLSSLSPWIGQDEMQARYGVCGKTLLNMERRREIPPRKNGRWSRVEVLKWERV